MGIVKALFVTLALLVATVPAAMAQSFNVTVGGTNYNVVGLGSGNSFNDNAAAITAAPWWGDVTLASGIATAVRALSGPTPYHAIYAWTESGTAFSARIYVSSASSIAPDTPTSIGSLKTNTSVFGAPFNFFTGSIVPVPELDAPALLQALFILLAFGLWLKARPPRALERRAASRPTSPRTRG